MRSTHYIYAAVALAGAVFCSPHPSRAQTAPVGQVVAGYDPTGLKTHPLNIDSQGRLNVVGTASGGTVFGPDAPNTTATQSPVRIAGCSVALSNTCVVRNMVIDASGFPTVNINGNPAVAQSGSWNVGQSGNWTVQQGNAPWSVGGNVASGLADAGNPLKIGGVYNATLPTVTTGQRVDLQMTARGLPMISACDPASSGSSGCANTIAPNGDSQSNSALGLIVVNRNYLAAGSTWNRSLDMSGGTSPNGGAGVMAVQTVPTQSGFGAIAPIVSAAPESSHVLKATAGNLYRVRVTTGNVAGYLMLFNATSAPVDGAVTPQSCTVAPANSTIEVDHQIPDRYSTGITAVFSSTGCFTKTASSTAMFEGSVE